MEKMNTCFIGTIYGFVIKLSFYVTRRFDGLNREKGEKGLGGGFSVRRG